MRSGQIRSLWTVVFADDIVICSERREEVWEVSRSKTEYMYVNEKETGEGRSPEVNHLKEQTVHER